MNLRYYNHKVNINFIHLITAIVGGLFINFYYPIFLVCVYILKNVNKNLSLSIFVLYLLFIGFLISFKSIYENWEVIFFVVIPHLLVLIDLLKDDDTENLNIFIVFILLISYFFKYLFFVLVLIMLFFTLYREFDIRGITVIIGFVILSVFIFWQYFNLLSYDNLRQVMVLIGFGLISFFLFLLKKE